MSISQYYNGQDRSTFDFHAIICYTILYQHYTNKRKTAMSNISITTDEITYFFKT